MRKAGCSSSNGASAGRSCTLPPRRRPVCRCFPSGCPRRGAPAVGGRQPRTQLAAADPFPPPFPPPLQLGPSSPPPSRPGCGSSPRGPGKPAPPSPSASPLPVTVPGRYADRPSATPTETPRLRSRRGMAHDGVCKGMDEGWGAPAVATPPIPPLPVGG
ncbi:hypothetical protein I4F81_004859 [Pyropia yezoensis]|uniref:Uncharacterized protein n=1 Tax=Pyropia yezoensis TaxID=2788 RepID=A0ACC3BWL4_PYRYE|nr:hypothetical protein I4F81_004859 [Neopyropia yezoensis]